MTRLFLVCLVSAGLVGCGSKPKPEAAPSAPAKNPGVSIDGAGSADPAAPPEAPAAPPPPTPTEAPAPEANMPATDLRGSTELDDMSKLLQQFVVERKRFPTDVAEMAKLMGFRLPRLVPGATLVIDKENKQIRYIPPK